MRKTGFTLLELLIVIAILAILVGAMIPLFKTNKLAAQIAKAKADLDALALAGRQAFYDTGYAVVLSMLADVTVSEYPGWNGPYINEVRRDPWGGSYRSRSFIIMGESLETMYYISLGPNQIEEFSEGGTDNGDDIYVYVSKGKWM